MKTHAGSIGNELKLPSTHAGLNTADASPAALAHSLKDKSPLRLATHPAILSLIELLAADAAHEVIRAETNSDSATRQSAEKLRQPSPKGQP
jgi:hypothetical protein